MLLARSGRGSLMQDNDILSDIEVTDGVENWSPSRDS